MKFFTFGILFNIIITSSALAQWTTLPNENTRVSHGGLLPQMVTDHNGGAFIVYQDSPDSEFRELFVQRIDRFGVVRFPDRGIAVSDDGKIKWITYFLVPSPQGGVFIIFRKNLGDLHDEVFGQHIDSTGQRLWGDKGIRISTNGVSSSMPLAAAPDRQGGVFVYWADMNLAHDQFTLKGQRLTDSGESCWSDSGKVIKEGYTRWITGFSLDVTSDGDPVLFYETSDNRSILLELFMKNGNIVWSKTRTYYFWGKLKIDQTTNDIVITGLYSDSLTYDQSIRTIKIGINGEYLTPVNGLIIKDPLGDYGNFRPVFTIHPNSEITVVWQEQVIEKNRKNTFYNKIKTDATLTYSEPQPASVFDSDHGSPAITNSNSNETIITWKEHRDTIESGMSAPNQLYCQKISATGEHLWGENDVAISTDSTQHVSYKIISDGNGGAIVCWYEIGSNSGWGIFAKKVSSNGIRGEVVPTAIVEEKPQDSASQVQLFQSYPNPFQQQTTISYFLPCKSSVQLSIFTINGKEVKQLVNTHQNAGKHQTTWDGTDFNGAFVGSGLYFYQLSTDSRVLRNKTLFIK